MDRFNASGSRLLAALRQALSAPGQPAGPVRGAFIRGGRGLDPADERTVHDHLEDHRRPAGADARRHRADVFLNFDAMPGMIDELSKTPMTIIFAGYAAFVPGLAIVYFHNRWTAGWPWPGGSSWSWASSGWSCP